MTKRFAWPALLLASLALGTVSRTFAAADFERPGASLTGAQVSGPNFHIENPVHSDGLMHH